MNLLLHHISRVKRLRRSHKHSVRLLSVYLNRFLRIVKIRFVNLLEIHIIAELTSLEEQSIVNNASPVPRRHTVLETCAYGVILVLFVVIVSSVVGVALLLFVEFDVVSNSLFDEKNHSPLPYDLVSHFQLSLLLLTLSNIIQVIISHKVKLLNFLGYIAHALFLCFGLMHGSELALDDCKSEIHKEESSDEHHRHEVDD